MSREFGLYVGLASTLVEIDVQHVAELEYLVGSFPLVFLGPGLVWSLLWVSLCFYGLCSHIVRGLALLLSEVIFTLRKND